MEFKDLLPDVHKPADVVATLAGGLIAYWGASKLLKVKMGKLHQAKPLHAAGAVVAGFVGGHLGYVEYEKHEQATKVSGYLGMG